MVGVPKKMLGIVLDIANKLGSADGEMFYEALTSFVRNWRRVVTETAPQVLALISAGEELVLGPLDGSRTIARARDIFSGYLDSDFRNWGLDVSSRATEEARTQVFEMRRDANFADMFGSLARPLSELTFTQDQIIEFCLKYPNWLRQDGYATFFLFEVNGEIFVARVLVYPLGFGVRAFRFGRSRVWGGEGRRRVVVPQLDLSV